LEGESQPIDINDLFERFGHKCFKTKKPLDIKKRRTWAIDHILPSKWLYPLTKENAALLSREANDSKGEKWPSQFYTNNELIELAKITGADLGLISSRLPILNNNVNENKCVERYLKVREKSNLKKRISGLKKIIKKYGLIERLTIENRKILGF
jgi:hypothetical protein